MQREKRFRRQVLREVPSSRHTQREPEHRVDVLSVEGLELHQDYAPKGPIGRLFSFDGPRQGTTPQFFRSDEVARIPGNESAHVGDLLQTMTRVFMFPGQSSAGAGALARAFALHPAARDVARRAEAVLGPRLARYLDPNGAPLDTNRDVQLTVFLATQMHLAALEAEGVDATLSLGLSLGEYSHVVHIGALDFTEALALVDERGRCYDEAPRGVMVTVLAADHDAVAAAVDSAAAHGVVVISNYNTPLQHVIAGEAAAVRHAVEILESEHGAWTTTIEERVAMHSPLMQEAAETFARALERADWRDPRRPYLPNVCARLLPRPRPHDFIRHLARHVSEPVRWQASIDHLLLEHPDAELVEVGPGGVLHNMLARAWRDAPRARTDAPQGEDPRGWFARTVEALHARS
jgi:[acyl-carrier-protein] S-malonyltransferase